MTFAVIGAIVLIVTLFCVLMACLLSGLPQETLEEQAACIKHDYEEKARKKRQRAEERARRRKKWHG